MNVSIPFSVKAKNMPTDLRRVCRHVLPQSAAAYAGLPSFVPQQEGTVGGGRCLRDCTRGQREVPDDPAISGKYWRELSAGAIFMAITAEDFYRSSNGDRWQLIRDIASGRTFVRHEPNLSSGGRTTDTDVEEFLNRTGSSPENLALRALLDKQTRMDPELVPEAKSRGPDKARRQRPA